jgi:hypothetical protein
MTKEIIIVHLIRRTATNIGIAASVAGRCNLRLQKARQQFRADEYKIPHHRQYLPVVGKFNRQYIYR